MLSNFWQAHWLLVPYWITRLAGWHSSIHVSHNDIVYKQARNAQNGGEVHIRGCIAPLIPKSWSMEGVWRSCVRSFSLYYYNHPLFSEMSHRFSQCVGRNVALCNNGATACRVSKHFNEGIVFSNDPLRADEMFEVGSHLKIKIDLFCEIWKCIAWLEGGR